jgi:hypothetical protein
MQDRSIIKVCQDGHILAFLILGGVDLRNLFFLEVFFLIGENKRRHKIREILRSGISSVTLVGTYINQLDVITLSKVMKDAGFVEECEIGHVFNHLELRWLHLANHIFPHRLLLFT